MKKLAVSKPDVFPDLVKHFSNITPPIQGSSGYKHGGIIKTGYLNELVELGLIKLDSAETTVRRVQMTLEEVSSIPAIDCQRALDRDTYEKWSKSGDYSPYAAPRIIMWESADGSLYVIDGNTRLKLYRQECLKAARLGKASLITIPKIFDVFIYPIKNKDDATRFYYAHDSTGAVERADQKVKGTMIKNGTDYNHPSLSRGTFTKAAQTAWEIIHNHGKSISQQKWTNERTQDLLTEFSEVLEYMDANLVRTYNQGGKCRNVNNNLLLFLFLICRKCCSMKTWDTAMDLVNRILDERFVGNLGSIAFVLSDTIGLREGMAKDKKRWQHTSGSFLATAGVMLHLFEYYLFNPEDMPYEMTIKRETPHPTEDGITLDDTYFKDLSRNYASMDFLDT